MDQSLLEDPAAVAAMAAGNPAGLEAVYRRYADRLYAYARSIVGDDDTAADVIQETFLLAQERVRQLRDPERISSWLYAIARNECLAKLRARKRTVMLAESHEPILDTDPGRAVHAEQVRELVHAAAAGMNDGDREVFELTVRHGMPAADVARVLDVSEKHAHARISRARSQFEGALGALVLARDGRGRCPELDAIVQGWDGQLTALLRKRIERHSRDCDVCSQRRRERMNPAGLLAGYAALPFLAVAAELWPKLKLVSAAAGFGGAAGGAAGPAAPGAPTAEAAGAPPTQAAGAPTAQAVGAPPGGSAAVPTRTLVMPALGGSPPPQPVKRSPVGLILGGAAVIVLIIASVTAIRLITFDRPTPPATDSFASVATSVGSVPSASVSPTPSPTPSPSPSPSPSPEVTTAPPTTRPAGPFTATVTGRVLCPQRAVAITADATAPLAAAQVLWRPPLNAESDMLISGSSAQATLDDELPTVSTILWHVELSAADGRTYSSPETVTVVPC